MKYAESIEIVRERERERESCTLINKSMVFARQSDALYLVNRNKRRDGSIVSKKG